MFQPTSCIPKRDLLFNWDALGVVGDIAVSRAVGRPGLGQVGGWRVASEGSAV